MDSMQTFKGAPSNAQQQINGAAARAVVESSVTSVGSKSPNHMPMRPKTTRDSNASSQQLQPEWERAYPTIMREKVEEHMQHPSRQPPWALRSTSTELAALQRHVLPQFSCLPAQHLPPRALATSLANQSMAATHTKMTLSTSGFAQPMLSAMKSRLVTVVADGSRKMLASDAAGSNLQSIVGKSSSPARLYSTGGPSTRKFVPNLAAVNGVRRGPTVAPRNVTSSSQSVKDENETRVAGMASGSEDVCMSSILLQTIETRIKNAKPTAVAVTKPSDLALNCHIPKPIMEQQRKVGKLDTTRQATQFSGLGGGSVALSKTQLSEPLLQSDHGEQRLNKGKKSKDLLEVSWGDSENAGQGVGAGGVYTPISLPFVMRQELDEVDEEPKDHAERGCTDDVVKKRRRRPTARHVDEGNRFAAALLLADVVESDGKRESADTWDLADDEEKAGIDFLHICFPFVLPPLNRQAMADEKSRKNYTSKYEESFHNATVNCRKSKDTSAGAEIKASPNKVEENVAYLSDESPPIPLSELPEGRMGKLLVHRSGRVRLKLLCKQNEGSKDGFRVLQNSSSTSNVAETTVDRVISLCPKRTVQRSPCIIQEHGCAVDAVHNLYNAKTKSADNDLFFEVNVGSECTFAQEVGCLMQDTSEFVFLGRCSKRMVVTPDVRRCLSS